MAEADGSSYHLAPLSQAPIRLSLGDPERPEGGADEYAETAQIDVVSDVVCPWCYIGKHRIESALALVPDVPVKLNFRPFFLNPWVPSEGISREEYLTKKFGSVEAYKGIAGRVVAAANEEGLVYRPELVARQPNTTD